MSDAWKSYRGAPAEGAELCAIADIPEDNPLCLELEGFPFCWCGRRMT